MSCEDCELRKHICYLILNMYKPCELSLCKDYEHILDM